MKLTILFILISLGIAYLIDRRGQKKFEAFCKEQEEKHQEREATFI